MKTITVRIGGRDLSLRGVDEEKILEAAIEVDSIMQQIQQKTSDQSTTTVAVLAALNIAEKYHEAQSKASEEIEYLKSEVEKMHTLLVSMKSV